MTEQGVMEQVPSTPLARQARVAGLCYLTVTAGGLFAEGFVRGSLIVPGDAAATAQAIADNEALWRWGLAVHLLYLVPAIEDGALAALGEGQRQALSYLAVRQFPTGFGFALLFFAGFCVLVGVLILRSRLVPHVIGAMMILAGACYVVNTLALVLSPALSDRLVPGILLPVLLAELSLALWLAVKGVKVEAPES